MILKNFKRESLIPLPVAFISTISEDGVRNIAPYSCVMPVLRPFDLVCAASAATMRHTLDNIRSTGEFVLNMPGVDMVESVIPTAKFSSAETDEFELAGLEEKHSKTIKTPGINGCYAWMECQLYREFEDEYNGFSYTLIIGKVTYLEIEDNVYNPEDGSWDVEKAKPLMMTGSDRGMHFCTIKDINKFEPFGAMFPSGKDPLEGMYK